MNRIAQIHLRNPARKVLKGNDGAVPIDSRVRDGSSSRS